MRPAERTESEVKSQNEKLCIMHYALCIMHYALCIMQGGHIYEIYNTGADERP